MSSKLLDAIYNTLKNDMPYLALLGIMPSSPTETMTSKIYRGLEPDKPVTKDTTPQVMLITMPGRFSHNQLVYEGKLCIESYGKTSHEARQLAGRSFELLHDKQIVGIDFRTFRCTLAFDSDFATGIIGVKGCKAIYDVDYLRMN